MNIRNEFQPLHPIAGDTQISSAGKASGNSGASAAAAAGDQAHLSSAASLASHAASLPDVRAEKVESVQAAIASGNYSISSTDVAHSLISHMLGGK